MSSNSNASCDAGTPLLTIRNLHVDFDGLAAVDRVNLSVAAGEVLGIVGESGSGKSVTSMALMGLIDPPGRVRADELRFDGVDLLRASPAKRRRIIGKDIAMVFQDALTSLNPSYTVGYQIKEVLRLHEGLRGAALERRALDLLEQVGIPDAKNRINAFPHQMSGGMNQRVMIAMAVACNPKLLIADEPTTALDVTIQAQIMDLLVRLQKERGMALVLISHDLAVVSEVAQRVAVMYAGEIIEMNRVPDIFSAPHHPYTEALLAAIPEHNRGARRLAALSGMVPGRGDRPSGCLFAPRCKYVVDDCGKGRPALVQLDAQDDAMRARCIRVLNVEKVAAPIFDAGRIALAGATPGDDADEGVVASAVPSACDVANRHDPHGRGVHENGGDR
ncbi:Dipeptide transport ATP-binding protein dppD [Mycetohabitans rhizoxinica HKI 454]|uniref:Dipeptide transport ATP-binding protein dppD n=1 Tax=Mycetohabitans rhizoxinica (strain DSM 19002 / CIP 109453 / HKI 454) TaxID=882378 RepID=E5AMS5_MYCRK|nr:ABC transporter ATP-binding protein [Mycetohabitans sp. B6]CBW76307.1 Dipeptide transport ATP-binding protein dppD [Mycetohabitans rhizoxinica HKI 454]